MTTPFLVRFKTAILLAVRSTVSPMPSIPHTAVESEIEDFDLSRAYRAASEYRRVCRAKCEGRGNQGWVQHPVVDYLLVGGNDRREDGSVALCVFGDCGKNGLGCQYR